MPSFSQKFIGVTLPIRLGNNGMFQQSTTVIEQTRSNFKNLILTKKGERLNQPTLGCDLWKVVLFNELTPEVIERARISVIEAVGTWLPYLELIDFQVQPLGNENTLNIQCLYRFRNNPQVTDQVTITFGEQAQDVAVTKQKVSGITVRGNRALTSAEIAGIQ